MGYELRLHRVRIDFGRVDAADGVDRFLDRARLQVFELQSVTVEPDFENCSIVRVFD